MFKKTHSAANDWPIWTQKGGERSVKMWATNFFKSFFKNILFYMNGGLSKIRSLQTYFMHNGCFILNGIVYQLECPRTINERDFYWPYKMRGRIMIYKRGRSFSEMPLLAS